MAIFHTKRVSSLLFIVLSLRLLMLFGMPTQASAQDSRLPAWVGKHEPFEQFLVTYGAFPQQPHLSPRVNAEQSLVNADLLRYPLPPKVAKRLRKAHNHRSAADHPSSIRELNLTLQQYPAAAPYVYNLLGIEYIESGEYRLAYDAFAKVLEVMPHVSVNHSNLGLALAFTGDKQAARNSLYKALRIDPKNAMAQAILAELDGVKPSRQ